MIANVKKNIFASSHIKNLDNINKHLGKMLATSLDNAI